MKLLFTVIFALVIVGVGLYLVSDKLTEKQSTIQSKTMEKISFIAKYAGFDRVKIVGNYWNGTNNRAVILLHMMPATKESWNEFADTLNAKGYHVLAIDLRGHGESTKRETDTGETIILDYQKFSDKEHQDSIHDVEGARHWLTTNKGIAPENIFIGGASIGANLALKYMAEHPETERGFLLSPGLNYHGITTEALARSLTPTQQLFVSAAENDDYAAESSRVLAGMKDGTELKLLPGQGARTHGTDLFTVYPSLMDELVSWLSK